MTTPPPPPGQPWWPGRPPAATPTPTPPPPTAQQSWWTGGRITIAVVVVLLLTGGAAAAGFFAGLAVGSADDVLDDSGITVGPDGGLDVPGLTPLDAEAVAGPPLRRGGATPGQLEDAAAVAHELTVDADGRVVITVSSPDFDTVLVLLDADGALVASDDDGAGAGTDSLLDVELEAGTYTVRVQSWGGSGSGAYSVTVD